MPIYEYQCARCGHQFETLVMGQTDAPAECPKCGHKEVSRRLSAVAAGGLGTDKKCGPSGSGFS